MPEQCRKALRLLATRCLPALLALAVANGQVAADPLPLLPKDFGEQVVMIPSRGQPSVKLETTIFKPEGPGPFPLVVFNHGKETGDARGQARLRPMSQVREFLLRGYVVAAPNRKGFARSGGTYLLHDCDVAADGLRQQEDVRTAIDYMRGQPYVDANRIVVAGASQGGLVTIAYGAHPGPGVRGLINFNGGSRQIHCPHWEDNIVRAFAEYGDKATLPSLWIYGDNDRFWSPELVGRMAAAFRRSGGNADFVDIGTFKGDSHRLAGDPDGTGIWWPPVESFLARLGLPTRVAYRPPEMTIPPSGFAAVDQAEAVPYLDARGRDGYREFLKHGSPRAFAISARGNWGSAAGGDDPVARAVAGCQKHSNPCRPYAVDDQVVWTGPAVPPATPAPTPPATGYAALEDVGAVPYLTERGREIYRQFLARSGPRAFVVSPNGGFTTGYGGKDPLAAALDACRHHAQLPCEPYAVNDRVVWQKRQE